MQPTLFLTACPASIAENTYTFSYTLEVSHYTMFTYKLLDDAGFPVLLL